MAGAKRHIVEAKKPFGHLEGEVMEVLWAKGRSSGKDVHGELSKRRDIAMTTVFTVLERLTKKGLLKKHRVEGVFLFGPAYSKDEFARRFSKEVLKGIFEISTSSASASFVDILAESDPVELDRLAKLIEQKKKELKKR